MMDPSNMVLRKTIGESAENEAKALAKVSKLQPQDHILKVDWNDIDIQSPIGFGGFSLVFKVQLKPQPHLNGGIEEDEELENGGGKHVEAPYYALKSLNSSTKVKPKHFQTGAVDLAIEGEILSRLCHENVIQLHAIHSKGPFKSFVEDDRGYFLVLDLLEDTLQNRLDTYRTKYLGASSSGGGGLKSSKHLHHGGLSSLRSGTTSTASNKYLSQSVVLERVASVAMGVAKGMEYLHSQKVCLRDLKPDNVGFDRNGTAKIFDLGFARELHTIRPTEVAGSLRYMAPEVALGRGSKLESDIYSFGVLLWEICTLDKPYKHIQSRDEFLEVISMQGWRHTTSVIPSNSIRKLIKQCWDHDAEHRPPFSKVVSTLRVELKMHHTTANTKSKGFGSTATLKRINTWSMKKKSSASALSTILRPMSRHKNMAQEGNSTVGPSMIAEEGDSTSNAPVIISNQKNATFDNHTSKTSSSSSSSSTTTTTTGKKKPSLLEVMEAKKSQNSRSLKRLGSCPDLIAEE